MKMKTRITHFANVKVGEQFISLGTGRLFRRIRKDQRGYNASCVNEIRRALFGANQFVKAISIVKSRHTKTGKTNNANTTAA